MVQATQLDILIRLLCNKVTHSQLENPLACPLLRSHLPNAVFLLQSPAFSIRSEDCGPHMYVTNFTVCLIYTGFIVLKTIEAICRDYNHLIT